MSIVFDHAKKELELLGEEPDFVKGYLDMIQIFEKMGHSGGSASVFIPTLNRLLQLDNLTPLTSDPDEWEHHGPDFGNVWQSRRNPKAMSYDGGKTYYLVENDQEDVHGLRYYHTLPITE